jgi:hypothetical protein
MLSVDLESGDDVVIIEGEAEKTTITDDELAKRVVDASNAKYGYGMQLPPPPMWVLRPTTAFAWTNLAANATRWRFG